jgi:hypothetical protein
MNDPLIYPWLTSPPWPFTNEHAQSWLEIATEKSEIAWKEFLQVMEARADGRTAFIADCPLRSIREEGYDGGDILLGDCVIRRHGFLEVADVEERTRRLSENDQRIAGDPNIIWQIGGTGSFAT